MTSHWLGRIILLIVAMSAPVLLGVLIGDPATDGMSMQAVTYGVACVAVVGIEHLRRGGSVHTSGLVPTPRSSRLALLGVAWAMIALLCILLIALLLGGQLEVLSEPTFSMTGLSTIILFAIGEEVVFRGTILEALRERFGPLTAILVTSILFGLAHASNPGASTVNIINVTLAGVALGTAVVGTSSLWMAIGFHVTWNVALSSVFGVVSGIDLGVRFAEINTAGLDASVRPWLTGVFGVEEGYLTTILLVLSVATIARFAPYDPYVQAARYRRSFSS